MHNAVGPFFLSLTKAAQTLASGNAALNRHTAPPQLQERAANPAFADSPTGLQRRCAQLDLDNLLQTVEHFTTPLGADSPAVATARAGVLAQVGVVRGVWADFAAATGARGSQSWGAWLVAWVWTTPDVSVETCVELELSAAVLTRRFALLLGVLASRQGVAPVG